MRLSSIVLLSLLFISQVAGSEEVKIVGSIDKIIKAKTTSVLLQQQPARHIKFLKIKLSKKATDLIAARHQLLKKQRVASTLRTLPSHIELGMNGVPVLDQGNFGTCATFANTAAIDAIMGQGDYISQACLLLLGNHLQENGYGVSGWDGSNANTVLYQVFNFGIVSKENERKKGCAGLFSYPKNEEMIPTSAMDLKDYHELSELPVGDIGQVISLPILDLYKGILERTDTIKTIDEIKYALSEGDRVSMGVLLADLDLGVAGAVGRYHAENDTWLLTPEIERDLFLRPVLAGHEMLITGYDDHAVAIDEHGRAHQGLFTLRNSWGSDIGDKGDFYMSYDYFRVLALEAQRISQIYDMGGE